ncbi:Pectin lyase-like superfamily protein [Forsythia ovata]|uniref:Pectin lyase-like superfamily protein n=1 Tax=Forsythia ovata TaxID=205694 RepID=A0ABD1SHU6_9LAMI
MEKYMISTYNVHGYNIFNVTDNGATPDGKRDSSQALLNTWDKACKADGGTMLVPYGTYFVKSAIFQGPCNGQTIFNLMGTLKASSSSSIELESWIEFNLINGLGITGNGKFDGQGASTWAHMHNCNFTSSCTIYRSDSIKLNYATNSSVQGVTSTDGKMFHFHVNNCENVAFNNVTISAHGDSPNTDGIHIARSNNIKISNMHIGTGDHCISIGPGSTNIKISGIACGPGHGISIGSLRKYHKEKNVSGITVRNCTLNNTKN